MKGKTIVFATENPGKLREVKEFGHKLGYEVLSPSQAGLVPVEVEETGSTYEENARLKVEAYLDQEAAKDLIICGDDTGAELHALGGEPGLHTRRWLGYRMSDDEIIGYTLGRLHGVQDRSATFKSTIAYSVYGGEINIVSGSLNGHITQVPIPEAPREEGVPFRSIFIVDSESGIPLWKFHDLSLEQREGIYTHREKAFAAVLEALESQK